MPHIAYSTIGDTPFQKLLGHAPAILPGWNSLEASFFTSSTFSPDLLEQVRRTLAFGNGCEYCMAKGAPADQHDSLRTSLAVGYAQAILHDHRALEDSLFQVLREMFTEAEIAELTAFICFVSASQRFGAILNLRPGE